MSLIRRVDVRQAFDKMRFWVYVYGLRRVGKLSNLLGRWVYFV